MPRILRSCSDDWRAESAQGTWLGSGRCSGQYRWRRGGLYEFSAGEHGLTFRLGDRGAITVNETTLTWTPAGGGSSQTAKLFPLSDQ